MNTPVSKKPLREQFDQHRDDSSDEVTGEHEVEDATELHIPTFTGEEEDEGTVKTEVPPGVRPGR